MKTLTIQVEDSKYASLINLLKKLSFVKVDSDEEVIAFTESEKQLLDSRFDELIQGKVDTINWEIVQDFLK